MLLGIKTLDNVGLAGKTVLCRVDLGAADSEAGDKLRACLPTIRELSDAGARAVLLTHRQPVPEGSPAQDNARLSEIVAEALGRGVLYTADLYGPAAVEAVRRLDDGQVLLLDNLCRAAEEREPADALSREDLAKTPLVERLSPVADLYVNDAFSLARLKLPSICGFPAVLPSVMGRLMERELTVLTALLEQPARPCLFVLGGNKLSDALQIADTVLAGGIADQVLLGGLVALLFLWADGYEIGEPSKALIRAQGGEQLHGAADRLMERYHDRIVLPTDYGYVVNGERREAMLHVFPGGELVTDIGAGTAELFSRIIQEARTVFVNGPMGVYERPESELGTRLVWEALGATGADVILGGQDTVAVTKLLGKAALVSTISTGGEALIDYLTGRELPALQALRYSAVNHFPG